MSRLLDRLKNAERKRGELRGRRPKSADSVEGAAEEPMPSSPALAPDADKAAAKTGPAGDDQYWAEVKGGSLKSSSSGG